MPYRLASYKFFFDNKQFYRDLIVNFLQAEERSSIAPPLFFGTGRHGDWETWGHGDKDKGKGRPGDRETGDMGTRSAGVPPAPIPNSQFPIPNSRYPMPHATIEL